MNALFNRGFLHPTARNLQQPVPSVEWEGTVRPMQANSHMKGDIKGTRKKMHITEQTSVPEPVDTVKAQKVGGGSEASP